MAWAMTASAPRSSISRMKCQRRPCSCIQVEGLDRRPVAAQPDLDEVLALDRARLDEPAHRRAVAGEHAPVVGGGVGMGVEVDDADAARAADLGDGRRARPGDRVIAAEDDRDGAGLRRPRGPCGRSSRGRARSRPGRCWRRPASTTVRTSNGSTSSWSELIEPGRVLRLADGPRPEAGPRPVADRVVERRADDRDVDLAPAQLGRIGDPRQLHEADRADVGRQVEVGVGLVRRGPSRWPRRSRIGSGAAAESAGSWGRSATGTSGRRDGAGAAPGRGQCPPSRSGRRRFVVRRPAGRAARW